MKGFDKGIDERPFPQGGAFDMTPFDLSQVCVSSNSDRSEVMLTIETQR